MCVLLIQVHGYNRFFEVLPDEVENAEFVVEDMVSHVLLDLFGGGVVDDVIIRFTSNSLMGLQHCSIQIRAQCTCQGFTLIPRTKENMRLALEVSFTALLKELFGSVNVDRVTINPSPAVYRSDDPTFPCCISLK